MEIKVGVGAIILNPAGQIFMSKRGSTLANEGGKWECPGGKVRPGERLEEAIKREIEEETGMIIEIVELLGVCDYNLDELGQHWISPDYLCRVVSGEPEIREPEKCEEMGWFSLEKMEGMELSIPTQMDVAKLKEKYNYQLPNLYN